MAENNPASGKIQAQQTPEAATPQLTEDRRYVHVDGRVQIELDKELLDETDGFRLKMTFLDQGFKPLQSGELFLYLYLDKPIQFRYVNLMPDFVKAGFENSQATLIAMGLLEADENFEDLEESHGAAGMTSSGKPKPTG